MPDTTLVTVGEGVSVRCYWHKADNLTAPAFVPLLGASRTKVDLARDGLSAFDPKREPCSISGGTPLTHQNQRVGT